MCQISLVPFSNWGVTPTPPKAPSVQDHLVPICSNIWRIRFKAISYPIQWCSWHCGRHSRVIHERRLTQTASSSLDLFFAIKIIEMSSTLVICWIPCLLAENMFSPHITQCHPLTVLAPMHRKQASSPFSWGVWMTSNVSLHIFVCVACPERLL